MRSALFALPVVVALVGCSQAASEDAAASADNLTATSSDNGTSSTRECVIDTIVVDDGFLADFKAAVGTAYIKDFGGSFYPHIQIPGVFDAALPPTDEFGEWFYTIVGLNIEPGTGGKLNAILTGGPSDDPTLVTGKKVYDAAKAVFDSMTRATETTTEHHAAPDTFDSSWKRIRRASAGGRVACVAETNPDTGETRPRITCTFSGVQHTEVQIFSTQDAGGRCLAE